MAILLAIAVALGLVRAVVLRAPTLLARTSRKACTLCTLFFEKRGREGLGIFLFGPKKKKKNLGPPGLSILAKARKPCKVCNGAGAPGFFF